VLVIHSFLLGKLTGMVKDVRDYGRYMTTAAEIVEEGPSIEECMINQAEICSQGKSVNGRFRKFSPSYEKMIIVGTLKSVSLWGLKMSNGTVKTKKLCNIVPFNGLHYLNKLQLTESKCRLSEDGKVLTVTSFT